MRRTFLAFTALAVSLTACGPTTEPQGTLKGVRLIGVKKDKPYAAPGDTVKFSMLLHDGATQKRKVSVKWFGGCDNPPGDSYAGCFLGVGGGEGSGSFLGRLRPIGEGLETEYALPQDILDRPPPPGVVTPYGLSFVFFTACTGSLQPAPGEQIPIQCVDDSGARVGADGFVVGYTQVFAYEALRNENPKIRGFIIRDTPYEPGTDPPYECIGQDCVELAKRDFGIPSENPGPDGGTPGDGMPDGGTPGDGTPDAGAPAEPVPGDSDAGVTCDPATDPWCVDHCVEEDIDDCPKHSIKVDMNEAENNEIDEAVPGGGGEQMWVNYYVDHGKIESDVKLVRDATEGWQGDRSDTTFFAPQEPGPFLIWAAAHDNRGGVEWTRVQLYAR
jgi:hypothetical protein